MSLPFYTRFGRDVAQGRDRLRAAAHNMAIVAYAGSRPGRSDEHRTWEIICPSLTREQHDYVTRKGLPVVVVGDTTYHGQPRVGVDEAAAGAMAANHLMELGLRDFAYVGAGDWPWVRVRLRGFDAALGTRGMGPAEPFIGSLYAPRKRLRLRWPWRNGYWPSPCPVGFWRATMPSALW